MEAAEIKSEAPEYPPPPPSALPVLELPRRLAPVSVTPEEESFLKSLDPNDPLTNIDAIIRPLPGELRPAAQKLLPLLKLHQQYEILAKLPIDVQRRFHIALPDYSPARNGDVHELLRLIVTDDAELANLEKIARTVPQNLELPKLVEALVAKEPTSQLTTPDTTITDEEKARIENSIDAVLEASRRDYLVQEEQKRRNSDSKSSSKRKPLAAVRALTQKLMESMFPDDMEIDVQTALLRLIYEIQEGKRMKIVDDARPLFRNLKDENKVVQALIALEEMALVASLRNASPNMPSPPLPTAAPNSQRPLQKSQVANENQVPYASYDEKPALYPDDNGLTPEVVSLLHSKGASEQIGALALLALKRNTYPIDIPSTSAVVSHPNILQIQENAAKSEALQAFIIQNLTALVNSKTLLDAAKRKKPCASPLQPIAPAPPPPPSVEQPADDPVCRELLDKIRLMKNLPPTPKKQTRPEKPKTEQQLTISTAEPAAPGQKRPSVDLASTSGIVSPKKTKKLVRAFPLPRALQMLICYCGNSKATENVLQCKKCANCFHVDCTFNSVERAASVDQFYCTGCQSKNQALTTTFKEEPEEAERIGKISNTCGRCINCFRRKQCNKCGGQAPERCEHFICVFSAKFRQQSAAETHSQQPVPRVAPRMSIKRAQRSSDEDDEEEEEEDDDESVVEVKLVEPTVVRKARPPARRGLANVRRMVICAAWDCAKEIRPRSKYCSDDCGFKVAQLRMRLYEDELRHRYFTPPPAHVSDKLRELRALNTQRQQKLDWTKVLLARRQKLFDWLQALRDAEPDAASEESDSEEQSEKEPPEKEIRVDDSDDDEHDLDDDDDETNVVMYDCPVCACEFPAERLPKHVFLCFKREEKQIEIGGPVPHGERNPHDLFCDQYNKGSNSYCKRLRVMCADHYKNDLEKQIRVCGFPAGWTEAQARSTDLKEAFAVLDDTASALSLGFCRKARGGCHDPAHFNWLQYFVGLLELERLTTIARIDEICDRRRQICRVLRVNGDFFTVYTQAAKENALMQQELERCERDPKRPPAKP